MVSDRPLRAWPRSDWMARFTERLRELIPMLTDAVAYSLALATYPRSSQTTPEEAAEAYARSPAWPAGAHNAPP